MYWGTWYSTCKVKADTAKQVRECMESDGGFTYTGCRTRGGIHKLGAGTEAAPMAAMGRPHPGKTARENVALAKQEQEASRKSRGLFVGCSRAPRAPFGAPYDPCIPRYGETAAEPSRRFC